MPEKPIEPKVVSVDFRKRGHEDIFEAILEESKHHEDKFAPAVFAILRDGMAYREQQKGTTHIIDHKRNVIATIKAT